MLSPTLLLLSAASRLHPAGVVEGAHGAAGHLDQAHLQEANGYSDPRCLQEANDYFGRMRKQPACRRAKQELMAAYLRDCSRGDLPARRAVVAMEQMDRRPIGSVPRLSLCRRSRDGVLKEDGASDDEMFFIQWPTPCPWAPAPRAPAGRSPDEAAQDGGLAGPRPTSVCIFTK